MFHVEQSTWTFFIFDLDILFIVYQDVIVGDWAAYGEIVWREIFEQPTVPYSRSFISATSLFGISCPTLDYDQRLNTKLKKVEENL